MNLALRTDTKEGKKETKKTNIEKDRNNFTEKRQRKQKYKKTAIKKDGEKGVIRFNLSNNWIEKGCFLLRNLTASNINYILGCLIAKQFGSNFFYL